MNSLCVWLVYYFTLNKSKQPIAFIIAGKYPKRLFKLEYAGIELIIFPFIFD